MSNEHAPQQLSSRLPPGMQVGDWRVVDRQGQGAFGVIYRAVRVGQDDAEPVALKLSLYPWDHRFAREAEVLSRIHHPGVPRLLSRGVLRHVSGVEHPYFVMEWVEGTPLYTWAEQHAPSSLQVLLVLAQLARALEATHAAHCAHRDVKGDNVLVRHSDGRAVLIDFGSGHFQGAARLTWQDLPPGTPPYRSAQASLFHIRSVRDRDAYYPPSPADDVFALGVTAYRLVMGEYPPPVEPYEDEAGSWQVMCPDPRPLLERNSRLAPQLRELILRMLSDSPEARGTATELAEALEAAVHELAALRPPASPPHSVPPDVEPPAVETPSGAEEVVPRLEPRARVPVRRLWPALAGAALSGLLLWTLQAVHEPPEHVSASTQKTAASDATDAGTTAVGDSPPEASPASVQPHSEPKPVAQNPLPQPRPGQLRPDGKGRCQGRTQVAINGGCWVEVPTLTAEACAENGFAYGQGRCYAPALAPSEKPLPTTSPAEER
jgi:serine/threonine protein kinase